MNTPTDRSAAQKHRWTWTRDRSKGWCFRRKFGRVTLGVKVIRHRYVSSSDRWVFQPEVIYDRAS